MRKALAIAAIAFTAHHAQSQTTDVDSSEFNSVLLTGRLLGDGALYTGLRWNLGTGYNLNTFRFVSELSWYDFYGAGPQVIRRPYENLTVQGNGGSNILYFIAEDDPFRPGLTPYDISIRTLTINDATVWQFEDVNSEPIDLRFRSIIPGEPKEAFVNLNNGTLNVFTRFLTADADMDLTFHSQSGSNSLLGLNNNPVGKSLEFLVDPGSDFTMSFGGGPEVRYLAPSKLLVDAATLNIRGGGAKINLEMRSNGIDGLKILNGSQMQLGGTGFSDRFEYLSNLPQDGIQIIDSSLAIASVSTLEGYLLLDNATVTVEANGQLTGEEMDVSGNNKITSAGGKTHSYANLQATGAGQLELVGGEYEFSNLVVMLQSELILGEPGGGAADTKVSTALAGSFAPLLGGGLSGEGTFVVENPNIGARIISGAVVSPGFSIGTLETVGRISFESGSSLEVELDASLLAVNSSNSSDTINMNVAFPGQTNLLDIQAGAAMSVSVLNDQVLPPGTRAIVATYPDDNAWSGVSFNGFQDGTVVALGQNHWLVQYRDPFLSGLPQRVLSLTVVDPIAAVSPTHLDFAPQETGTLSPAQTVTVENVGSLPLVISGFQRFGTAFSISGENCTTNPIPVGDSCEFTVRFFSATAGDFTGAITVESNSFGQPPGLTMFGTAVPPNAQPQATVSPSSIVFSAQQLNTLSGLRSVTVANTGTDDLVINGLTTSSSTFVLRNDVCTSQTIAPGGSCQFSVGFLPQSVGAYNGTVTIGTNAGDPTTVALSGQGVEPGTSPNPRPVPVLGAWGIGLISIMIGLLGMYQRRPK